MDFKLTNGQEAFRQEFNAWLDKNIPEGLGGRIFVPARKRR